MAFQEVPIVKAKKVEQCYLCTCDQYCWSLVSSPSFWWIISSMHSNSDVVVRSCRDYFCLF